MRNAFPLFAITSLAIAASVAVASAQDASPQLDLAEIRARANEHSQDAEALANSVRTKADALAHNAKKTQQEAMDNRAGYAATTQAAMDEGPLDFDRMIRAQADAEAASLTETPKFIAFASFGMPEASLKALVRDVTKAGGVTVLRGFPQGDSRAFKRRLAAIWSDGDEAGALGIDPRLFRAFQIKAAPSFVMVASDFAPCDGFDCTDTLPPHDRVAGNITVAEALDIFARGGGPGARLAQLHLHRLQGERM
ncbi:type-F conjugative transfer system pilin assembly protein TrbC [Erythrobacter sp. SCSIO 43205]|uniref:type-F conjugative transfer system pilin assembly protein TrbC n=1 Tax=Erythrobacter sp. SCSIO 43205 TaxID=2779361 RepID=UPI001CA7EB22|nr:type-F conjugative transfer system pilin assembly protein TrbC [Erythrobacter sp. SCSIO 43205]UAB78952.1 type-F conjugative transfer system pilin assembly protein TrbC [Erythrobacter sp. SCSIO 43205]